MNHQAMDHDNMDDRSPYRKMLIMMVLSIISMYILMYAMVNVLGNVLNNLNQFYMAGLMTAAMVIIELGLMGMMHRNKSRNALIIAAVVVAGLVFFVLIRQQAAISDEQFLRSMIPHHAGAILMCEQASVSDLEIKNLCGKIISSQQAEIDQMRTILERLE